MDGLVKVAALDRGVKPRGNCIARFQRDVVDVCREAEAERILVISTIEDGQDVAIVLADLGADLGD